MSIDANCPSCDTKVRIPESLLGKKVKCPKCENIFTAEAQTAGFEQVEAEEEPRRREQSYARSASGTNVMVVKSIGVLSNGIVLGSLYALLGLIVGGLFTLLSLAGAAAGGRNAGPAAALFGVAAVVLIPIFYGVIGFIAGIITAALYNLVASLVGGIEIELKPKA